MHSTRTRTAVVLATSAAILALAAPASAKIWFQTMEGRHVRSGQRVVATITNCPGNPSCRAAVAGVPVYLRRPGHRRLVRVGRVSASGRLRFVVPTTQAGRYRLVARLRVAGRTHLLAASGTFRIARR